jgi:hypothetical protein
MVNGGRYCGEDADAGSSESGSSEEELVPTSEKVVASEEQEEYFEASDDESSGESISSDDEPKPKKRSRGRPRSIPRTDETKWEEERASWSGSSSGSRSYRSASC